MAVSDGLPHGDDVGDEVVALKLEGPEMAADTAEAHLDLIDDDQAPGTAHVSADAESALTGPASAQAPPITAEAAAQPSRNANVARCGRAHTYAATCWK